MNLLQKITNYFSPEPKTIIVTGAKPGDVIPLDSIKDRIILLPCPLQLRLTRACVCMTCDFITADCPMEKICRGSGCESTFIGGCTNYRNQEDINCEEKRRIFKEGNSFDGHIFRFGGRSKTDTTI